MGKKRKSGVRSVEAEHCKTLAEEETAEKLRTLIADLQTKLNHRNSTKKYSDVVHVDPEELALLKQEVRDLKKCVVMSNEFVERSIRTRTQCRHKHAVKGTVVGRNSTYQDYRGDHDRKY